MRRGATAFAILLAAAWFLGVGLCQLQRPGLYYDEVNFVNAALGGVGNDFVHDRLFGVPVRIMTYIGALKAWLYAPVFALLGVDVWTIRTPGLLFAAGTIALTCVLVKRLAGAACALCTLCVLATDPAFLQHSRTDFGPTVLMGLLKMGALAAFFAWLDRPRPRLLALSLGCLLLGLFDKMNFAWFVATFGVLLLALYGRAILEGVRGGGRGAAAVVAVFLVSSAVYLLGPMWSAARIHPRLPGAPEGMVRLGWFCDLGLRTLDGRVMSGFQFDARDVDGSWVELLPVAGLVLFPVAVSLAPRAERWSAARVPVLFASGTLGLFATIFFTPQAGGSHHLMMLWPFPQLFGLVTVAATLRRVSRAARVVLKAATAVLLVCVVASQVRVELDYCRHLAEPSTFAPRWSTAIYRLADEVRALDPDLVLTADWGSGTQLFCLAEDDRRARVHDDWLAFTTTPADPGAWEAELRRRLRGRLVAVVMPAEGYEQFPAGRRRALGFLAGHAPGHRVVRVPDAGGRTIYEVHVVDGR